MEENKNEDVDKPKSMVLPGKKLLDPRVVRNIKLNIRLNQEEIERLQLKYNQKGSISTVELRQQMLDMTASSPKMLSIYKDIQTQNTDLLVELSRIGNNINQIARRLNEQAKVGETPQLQALADQYLLMEDANISLKKTIDKYKKIIQKEDEVSK